MSCSHIILHATEMTCQCAQANFSECDYHHEYKQEPRDYGNKILRFASRLKVDRF